MRSDGKIQQWLKTQPDWVFISFTSLVAFATYSCMYAFRKPFTVATFDGEYLWGLQLKIWFIAAQVAGYTVSKFIGIKVVSEMPKGKRSLSILALVGIAELSLFFFGWTPNPFRIIFLFTNGLPLGMIWGLVFAYLEGRKYTELLGAGLSVSFILASGFVKTVGKWLMLTFQLSEYWMPFATGLLFAVPLILFVYLLDQVPEPNSEDKQLRTERKPMDIRERLNFFRKFSTAISLLVTAYALLTIFREMRDNFAAEIWNALDYKDNPAIFTLSEIPVGIVTLLILGMVTYIRNNINALFTIVYLIIIGFVIIASSSFLFQNNYINGLSWMILSGMGLYLAYVPFNALLFERMIASFRYVSNIGFVMYLADSFGYLSSIVSFSLKNFFKPSLSWLDFFVWSSYSISGAGIILMLASVIWFHKKYQQFGFSLNHKS